MVVLDFLNCNFKISSFGTLDVAHDIHEHEHSHAHDAYTDKVSLFLRNFFINTPFYRYRFSHIIKTIFIYFLLQFGVYYQKYQSSLLEFPF